MNKMYDDFTNGGYSSSMSFEEYIRQNSSPSMLKNAAAAYSDFTYGGYGSSMSFERYCQERGIIPVGSVSIGKDYNLPTVPTSKKKVSKLAERVNPVTAKRQELLQVAAEKSKTISSITSEEIEEWRIAKGYYWKVISPSGHVYTEVLKKITVKDPDDYVEYHAMCEAFFRIYGYNYVV